MKGKSEVELKFKVSNQKEFNRLDKSIASICSLIEISNHVDYYYSKAKINLKNLPTTWISLRNRSGKVKICLKEYSEKSVKENKYCYEYESEISSVEFGIKLFNTLGLKKYATIRKKRKTYYFKSSFEISFDYVVGLGYFIEIESLLKEKKIDFQLKELKKFTNSLNLQNCKIMKEGYPLLKLKK